MQQSTAKIFVLPAQIISTTTRNQSNSTKIRPEKDTGHLALAGRIRPHPSEEQIAGQGPGDASTAHRVQLDQSGPPCRIRPNATPSKKLLWSGRQGDGLAPRVRCIGLQNSGRQSTVTVAAATDLWALGNDDGSGSPCRARNARWQDDE